MKRKKERTSVYIHNNKMKTIKSCLQSTEWCINSYTYNKACLSPKGGVDRDTNIDNSLHRSFVLATCDDGNRLGLAPN